MENLFEDINCIICDKDDSATLYSASADEYMINLGALDQRRNVKICKKCSLAYLSPRFTEITLERLYTEKGLFKPIKENPTDVILNERANRLVPPRVTYMAQFINMGLRGSVLDIGCSDGSLLSAFKQIGWQPLGIEPSTEYAKLAREKYNLEIIESLFKLELFINRRKFDLVIATQVLEHTRDPIKFLKDIKSILQPNGAVYMDVPNLERPHVITEHYFGSQHLFYFYSGSLFILFNKAGYDVIDIDNETDMLRIIAVPSSKPVQNLSKTPFDIDYKVFIKIFLAHNLLFGISKLISKQIQEADYFQKLFESNPQEDIKTVQLFCIESAINDFIVAKNKTRQALGMYREKIQLALQQKNPYIGILIFQRQLSLFISVSSSLWYSNLAQSDLGKRFSDMNNNLISKTSIEEKKEVLEKGFEDYLLATIATYDKFIHYLMKARESIGKN